MCNRPVSSSVATESTPQSSAAEAVAALRVDSTEAFRTVVERAEVLEMIENAIAELPPAQRDVVELRTVQVMPKNFDALVGALTAAAATN